MPHDGLLRPSECYSIQWSLSGNIRTWGGVQCHIRGYIGSMGAIQWSLNGTRRSCVLWWYLVPHDGLLRPSECYSIQWSLSGNIRTWGGVQCHMRGYIGSRGAIQWSLNGTRGSWGGFSVT